MSDEYRALANAILRDYADATTRYAPRIVEQRCPFCDGVGMYATNRDALATLWEVQRCTACAGNGYITVEQT